MRLIDNVSSEKLRGGFYTPLPIANFIIKWALEYGHSVDILEPSCGDGSFLKQLKDSNTFYNSLTAVELDEVEIAKAKSLKVPRAKFINDDFHKFCNSTTKRFDVVLGNPPYIRFQYFNEEQQHEAEVIFKKAGLKYSKLTNAWVSFVVGSSLLLKEVGKIGFVLPAEILQVSYAKQLRNFLAHYFNKINIISFETLVFPKIQQEVVLLLCEKDLTDDHYIDHIELRNADDLQGLDLKRLQNPRKEIDFKSNKWTFYFLDQDEIDFLEKVKGKYSLNTIGDYAKIEVGITTGDNKFFTVPTETVNEFELSEYSKPMVGRSVQVNSIFFTKEDWNRNTRTAARSHLLVFPGKKSIKNKKALQYISIGEKEGINEGYKCSIRDEWFIVPSLKISDALFIRRNNLYPKLIINEAKAYTTDTMHRVFVNQGVNLKALVSSYYNSLSFASAEVSGRSHGGGVLELMPNEAESILLPFHISNDVLSEKIDQMIRAKKPIEEILDFTDHQILEKNLGMSRKEIQLARGIWKKLSKRRLSRGEKTTV
jgi:adenine-specific DNA-methyltransferase